jgi:hypothetical protein
LHTPRAKNASAALRSAAITISYSGQASSYRPSARRS